MPSSALRRSKTTKHLREERGLHLKLLDSWHQIVADSVDPFLPSLLRLFAPAPAPASAPEGLYLPGPTVPNSTYCTVVQYSTSIVDIPPPPGHVRTWRFHDARCPCHADLTEGMALDRLAIPIPRLPG